MERKKAIGAHTEREREREREREGGGGREGGNGRQRTKVCKIKYKNRSFYRDAITAIKISTALR
jgi:hypothetical protein